MTLIETVRNKNPLCPTDHIHGPLEHYNKNRYQYSVTSTFLEPPITTWSDGEPKFYCRVCRKYFVEREA